MSFPLDHPAVAVKPDLRPRPASDSEPEAALWSPPLPSPSTENRPMPRTEPHPFLRPLYRRIILIAACIAWLAFELTQQDTLWLILAGAATAYGVWDLFLSGNYRTPPGGEPRDPEQPGSRRV